MIYGKHKRIQKEFIKNKTPLLVSLSGLLINYFATSPLAQPLPPPERHGNSHVSSTPVYPKNVKGEIYDESAL